MTKQQEIEALRQFAASLPADTYLRPWLESILPSVESDIRSDIYPVVTPADARRAHDERVAAAQAKADEILNRANDYAAATMKEARQMKERAASHVRQALRSLES